LIVDDLNRGKLSFGPLDFHPGRVTLAPKLVGLRVDRGYFGTDYLGVHAIPPLQLEWRAELESDSPATSGQQASHSTRPTVMQCQSSNSPLSHRRAKWRP